MPGARFDREVIDASRVIDEEFASAWRFTPMSQGDDKTSPPVHDATRVACHVSATYFDPEAKPEMPNSYDVRQYRRPGVAAGAPRLHISESEIVAQRRCNPSFAVLAGDLFESAANSFALRVMAVRPTATGELRCTVNLAG